MQSAAVQEDDEDDGFLSQNDYANFVYSYCQTSPYPGPACRPPDDDFWSLDERLQRVFLSPSPFASSSLAYLKEKGQDFGSNRDMKKLCASTYDLLEPTGIIAVSVAEKTSDDDNDPSPTISTTKRSSHGSAAAFVQEQAAPPTQSPTVEPTQSSWSPTHSPVDTPSSVPSFRPTKRTFQWPPTDDMDPAALNAEQRSNGVSKDETGVKAGTSSVFVVVCLGFLILMVQKYYQRRRRQHRTRKEEDPALDGDASILTDDSAMLFAKENNNSNNCACTVTTYQTTGNQSEPPPLAEDPVFFSKGSSRRMTIVGKVIGGFKANVALNQSTALENVEGTSPATDEESEPAGVESEQEKEVMLPRLDGQVTLPTLDQYEEEFVATNSDSLPYNLDDGDDRGQLYLAKVEASVAKKSSPPLALNSKQAHQSFLSVYGAHNNAANSLSIREQRKSRRGAAWKSPRFVPKSDRNNKDVEPVGDDGSISASTLGSGSGISRQFKEFDRSLSHGFDDLKAYMDETTATTFSEHIEDHSEAATVTSTDIYTSEAGRDTPPPTATADPSSIVTPDPASPEDLREYFESLVKSRDEQRQKAQIKPKPKSNTPPEAGSPGDVRKYFESLAAAQRNKESG